MLILYEVDDGDRDPDTDDDFKMTMMILMMILMFQEQMEAMRLTGPALLVTKEDKKVRLFQFKGFELLLLFVFVFNCYNTLIIVTIQ